MGLQALLVQPAQPNPLTGLLDALQRSLDLDPGLAMHRPTSVFLRACVAASLRGSDEPSDPEEIGLLLAFSHGAEPYPKSFITEPPHLRAGSRDAHIDCPA